MVPEERRPANERSSKLPRCERAMTPSTARARGSGPRIIDLTTGGASSLKIASALSNLTPIAPMFDHPKIACPMAIATLSVLAQSRPIAAGTTGQDFDRPGKRVAPGERRTFQPGQFLRRRSSVTTLGMTSHRIQNDSSAQLGAESRNLGLLARCSQPLCHPDQFLTGFRRVSSFR